MARHKQIGTISMLRVNRTKRSVVAVTILVLSAAVGLSQEPKNNQRHSRPLQILVLGDSILWGQGLKTEHKTWHHIKVWLQKNTDRPVVERIEAHSGAVIERRSLTDNLTSPNSEVNLGLPTVHDQIDHSLQFYSDPSKVDLVLLSGCGNDVGVQKLLNASSVGEVNEMTQAKCGAPMENLLRRIARTFPSAYVIVTGYYPFFSEQTRNDFVLKGLARRFFKTRGAGDVGMSSKEIFERLKLNSKQWYDTSNARIAEAVRKVNQENGEERIAFAGIDFPAAYSFAAPQTRLWGFNRSPFRTALLFLSFGKVLLPSNDDVRKQRSASCDELYKAPQNETSEEKRDRKALRLFCRYASLGHPNRKGALLYADSITTILKSSRLVPVSSH
ncbi:MAG TPA: SGNH/GDSL hydrolase family protein [Pyrinomonadaceae bacterium]|nr:SGNH/GDSL hydrolase family protein [Pyrinomonadaceae bacterium]